jgi:pimeloyl-ACP methyl ester carboxylesterase
MTPIVLIHGGANDSRCWDLLLPLLGGPALAVDLPGRGAHPAELDVGHMCMITRPSVLAAMLNELAG